MTDWMEVLAIILMHIGLIFMFIGTLGVLRFEDVFLRLQASSKSLTFGLSFIVFGAAMMTGDSWMLGKAALAVVFQFLTAPIAAQMIARAAMRRGLKPVKITGYQRKENPDDDPVSPE